MEKHFFSKKKKILDSDMLLSLIFSYLIFLTIMRCYNKNIEKCSSKSFDLAQFLFSKGANI